MNGNGSPILHFVQEPRGGHFATLQVAWEVLNPTGWQTVAGG